MNTKKVLCVLVTYNRLEKLKTTLSHLEKQFVKPYGILVVNNASTDGTYEFLEEWKKDNSINKYIFHSESNLGGAGGFATAIEKSLDIDYDWIYIGDDDAYLDETAILEFENFITKHDDEKLGAVCGKVLEFGEIAILHRRRVKLGMFRYKEVLIDNSEFEKEYFKIDQFSFVGSFIKKKVVQEIGLPIKDYFIWYDDTEYSVRVSNRYEVVVVPKIVIHHDCAQALKSVTWKNYYGYRNQLDMIRRNYPKKYYRTFRFLIRMSAYLDLFKNKKKAKIKFDSLKDVKKNILGISEKYKPGTKI